MECGFNFNHRLGWRRVLVDVAAAGHHLQRRCQGDIAGGAIRQASCAPERQGAGHHRGRAPTRGRGSYTTTNDTLVLWVRQEYDASGNQFHNFQYYVYDKAGTACVSGLRPQLRWKQPAGQRGCGCPARRLPAPAGQIDVRVQEQGNGGQEMSEQKFVVSNPVRNSFAKWTAEPLPSTKEDDDLSVTLTKLVAGADMTYQRNQDNPDDALNKGVQVAFHVERAGKPVTNWRPVSVETTDATGNRTVINYGPDGNPVQWNGDEGTFTYQYGLWPDEPAWKLRMEFTQTLRFQQRRTVDGAEHSGGARKPAEFQQFCARQTFWRNAPAGGIQTRPPLAPRPTWAATTSKFFRQCSSRIAVDRRLPPKLIDRSSAA